jgi:hypothetical protein
VATRTGLLPVHDDLLTDHFRPAWTTRCSLQRHPSRLTGTGQSTSTDLRSRKSPRRLAPPNSGFAPSSACS